MRPSARRESPCELDGIFGEFSRVQAALCAESQGPRNWLMASARGAGTASGHWVVWRCVACVRGGRAHVHEMRNESRVARVHGRLVGATPCTWGRLTLGRASDSREVSACAHVGHALLARRPLQGQSCIVRARRRPCRVASLFVGLCGLQHCALTGYPIWLNSVP